MTGTEYTEREETPRRERRRKGQGNTPVAVYDSFSILSPIEGIIVAHNTSWASRTPHAPAGTQASPDVQPSGGNCQRSVIVAIMPESVPLGAARHGLGRVITSGRLVVLVCIVAYNGAAGT